MQALRAGKVKIGLVNRNRLHQRRQLLGLDGQAEEVLFVPEKSTVAEDSDIARNTLKVAADWKFQPGVEDGKPVRRRVLVPVRFEPPAKAAAPEA